MRVLVTGAQGGLGSYVVPTLRERGHEVLAPTRSELDLRDGPRTLEYVTDTAPLVVVHLAALSNVDKCEADPAEAVVSNVVVTENVVAAALRRGARIFLMSTNDVFSEAADGPFDEDRVPAPGNAYAWSKYVAERIAIAAGGAVVRANFFTRRCRAKQSFVDYVISSAVAGGRFRCYTNVVSTPVFAGTLADKIADITEKNSSGVTHVCTRDAVSRVGQAVMILRAYGLPTGGIDAVSLEDRRGRPLDARLAGVLGGVVGSVEEEIGKLVAAEPLVATG